MRHLLACPAGASDCWDTRAFPNNLFTLLRQEAPWLATGRNGVLGFGGFRKDAPRLGAGSFTRDHAFRVASTRFTTLEAWFTTPAAWARGLDVITRMAENT